MLATSPSPSKSVPKTLWQTTPPISRPEPRRRRTPRPLVQRQRVPQLRAMPTPTRRRLPTPTPELLPPPRRTTATQTPARLRRRTTAMRMRRRMLATPTQRRTTATPLPHPPPMPRSSPVWLALMARVLDLATPRDSALSTERPRRLLASAVSRLRRRTSVGSPTLLI
ncbi:hypothetical protein CGCFRS4_v013887 [Colletotrichum fructicola]|nr:hypothetical protein CGCFRS4_v013887 [Colletotrichum fructicola]KAF4926209.1 hypothetical protein CGCF245_v013721 [Colletotrichum fructicola]